MPPGLAAAKDKILFGCAISFSGMNAVPAEVPQVTRYKLWVVRVRVHHERTHYFFGKIQRDIRERLYVGPEYTEADAA